jgi:quercetin dioxygenase-like cupin family protein
MRIIELGSDRGREVTQHSSLGLRAQALVRAPDVAVTVLRVAAGGEIGRHPATVDQLFIVVTGWGEVSGDDETWHSVRTGQAVLWTAGEHHTTRAGEDLVALVVEMAELGSAVVG